MGSLEIKTKQKIIRFSELWNNYPKDTIQHPGKDSNNTWQEDLMDDHCAINVSEALLNSGVSLKKTKAVKCWGECPNKKYPSQHIIRATELAKWLEQKTQFKGCAKPKYYTGQTFKKFLDNKKGIIYFEDYWIDHDVRSGDHIDLWDDNELASGGYLGSLIRNSMPNLVEAVTGFLGDSTRITSLERSKRVIFWEID
ncbi:conserved hypothetical protein [Arcobacter nitrofigilis DSM 7299]|uniref:Type VI secretion system (T6SS), amidase effector protein 4 n=1 Tax=Arcobacter nitrofigilis (strain ATCC 33309 / DSM 7299 / CCUG 15893 / LMG 7604 / NCTC 12251 / CI) TaxID=572480 RepID=D5V1I1_ARCNC|nr:type VI secretion system amidase effector protein Tae4 [Arcobacter nitrofigilis]ADG93415.1 conserved hypothetical protein [Arcobacter nitrofigilis DSM 7299]